VGKGLCFHFLGEFQKVGEECMRLHVGDRVDRGTSRVRVVCRQNRGLWMYRGAFRLGAGDDGNAKPACIGRNRDRDRGVQRGCGKCLQRGESAVVSLTEEEVSRTLGIEQANIGCSCALHARGVIDKADVLVVAVV